MSIRCSAGMLEPDGKVKWIYIHRIGYVKGGAGEILMRHYGSEEDAGRLLKHGSASILAPELKDCVFHTRDWNRRPQWGPEAAADISGYIKAADRQTCAFAYLYSNGAWSVLTQTTGENPRIYMTELTEETINEGDEDEYQIFVRQPPKAARAAPL